MKQIDRTAIRSLLGTDQTVVLQLSKNSKRATGWIDQTQSHAATSKSLLMN